MLFQEGGCFRSIEIGSFIFFRPRDQSYSECVRQGLSGGRLLDTFGCAVANPVVITYVYIDLDGLPVMSAVHIWTLFSVHVVGSGLLIVMDKVN